MPVLVVNCGSTSIKAAVVDPETGRRLAELKVERISQPETTATFNDKPPTPCASSCEEALASCLPELLSGLPSDAQITSVGHRVVHGGSHFTSPTLLDDQVVDVLQQQQRQQQ